MSCCSEPRGRWICHGGSATAVDRVIGRTENRNPEKAAAEFVVFQLRCLYAFDCRSDVKSFLNYRCWTVINFWLPKFYHVKTDMGSNESTTRMHNMQCVKKHVPWPQKGHAQSKNTSAIRWTTVRCKCNFVSIIVSERSSILNYPNFTMSKRTWGHTNQLPECTTRNVVRRTFLDPKKATRRARMQVQQGERQWGVLQFRFKS